MVVFLGNTWIQKICFTEAQEGGTIGLLKDGDVITIDADKNSIAVDLTDEEIAQRRTTGNNRFKSQ
jgi:dihydroxyacid dehydratase/phosphogluconate dehydratase